MSGDAAGPAPPFFRSFVALAGPYWGGPGRLRPRLLLAAMVALVLIQVGLQIRLNRWSADLFNAIERRSTERALAEIEIFAVIVLATMAVNATHLVIRRYIQLDWRRWLTARVIGSWMADARHYQAGLIPGDHANPDGRIAEDIRVATEAGIDLASSLLYCVLLLVSFIGILWNLSGWITFAGLELPGHLVALALLYAGAGASVAFLLGRPLVRATDMRQTREADFRFGLVRARESAEPIALARGEEAERLRLGNGFEAIAQTWRAQSVGLARLLVFSSGYQTLAAVLPLLVGTPRFLAGGLTLGGLVQSAQAFQQVSSALSWPIDNLPLLAAWRASVERILALEEAVRTVALEAARTGETAINLDRAPGDWLGVRDLSVAAPDGTAMLSGLTLQVGPGEHVLVDGEPEAAAALFRVLAGIWPWGSGYVDLPADDGMLVAGSRPFLPNGTLLRALGYPQPAGLYPEATIGAALAQTGLGHLVPRLDEATEWERVLSPAELQRLSFARLLLHRPQWVVLGDATDALDPHAADEMLHLLGEALPHSGIIVIGRHPGSAETFSRRMTLQRAEDGQVLLHEVYARRAEARRPRPRSLAVVDWLRRGYGP